METNLIIQIVFYLVLLDAAGAVFVSYFGFSKWFHDKFPRLTKYFPITKGWTTVYLILILIIGYLIHQEIVALI